MPPAHMNDYQLALQAQAQYDGNIPIKTVSEVAYSLIDDANSITLIFRGTSDLSDAKRDLEALMTDSGFGRVHSGAWIGIPQVIDAEWDNFSTEKLIVLSGHSLGAMEAQLAFRELYRRGFNNLKCVTFECPRFGDNQAVTFCNQLENRTYQNYLNLFENDAFTMIPLHLPLEPYEIVPNCHQFWSAPTSANEWHDAPYNVQAHSLKDCVIPGLQKICAP